MNGVLRCEHDEKMINCFRFLDIYCFDSPFGFLGFCLLLFSSWSKAGFGIWIILTATDGHLLHA